MSETRDPREILREVLILVRVGEAAVPHLQAGKTKDEAITAACAAVAKQRDADGKLFGNGDPSVVEADYRDAASKRSSSQD